MIQTSTWKHLNLLVILLAACVLGMFILRAKLETEPQWRLMPPRKENLFVQHPLTWLTGDCYAQGSVLDALTETASTLHDKGIPVIIFALSGRQADAENTGWTADIGYVSTTPNGKFSQSGPALLTYGPLVHYDANGVSEGIVTTTVDPAATLAVIRALQRQTYASVVSISVAPFAMPMLEQAAHAIPPAEREQTLALLRGGPADSAFMHVTFSAAPTPLDHTLSADTPNNAESNSVEPQKVRPDHINSDKRQQ